MAASVSCVHCGEPLSSNENFCIKCGARRTAEIARVESAHRPARSSGRLALPTVLFLVGALIWGAWKTWRPDSTLTPEESRTENQQSRSPAQGPSKVPPTALEVPMGNYTGER